MTKVRFAIPFKTVLGKAFPDKRNSQRRKHKKSSLISPLPSTNLITRDNCFWLEQPEASSTKIEKNHTLDIGTKAINQFILGSLKDIACIFTTNP